MSIAICLVSGGMDSAVCATLAASKHTLAFLHVNYHQRTAARELQAFHALADHFQVANRLVLQMDYFKQMSTSSLLLGATTPVPVVKEESIGQSVPSTYVPFRNGVLLSFAAAWAEVLAAEKIFFGAVAQDSSGYPDCRAPFIQAMQESIQKGTDKCANLIIETPLVNLRKSEIVTLGMRVGTPFHLTFSCYQGQDVACGECESCFLRLRGFKEAGVLDPIKYAASFSV